MILSENQFEKLEQYAAAFFSFKEIALLLEVDIEDFIDEIENENSEVFKRYESSRLKSEFEIRNEIIKMAKMGSPAAQTEALKLIAKHKTKNL